MTVETRLTVYQQKSVSLWVYDFFQETTFYTDHLPHDIEPDFPETTDAFHKCSCELCDDCKDESYIVLLNFEWVTQDKCVRSWPHHVQKKIVPKCSTKFVVVHVWLVFSHPPQLGHVVGVYEAKLSSPILLPTNDLRVLFGVGQQFKQKLPKLNLSTLRLTGRWKEMSVIWFCDFWNETKILFIFAYLQLMLNWWTNIDYMNAYLGIFVKALAY